MATIVIKPGSRIDPVKESGPGLHRLTQVNLKKIKKYIFKVLIFYIKKIKKNLFIYKFYITNDLNHIKNPTLKYRMPKVGLHHACSRNGAFIMIFKFQ
jgi:hypothetical protein